MDFKHDNGREASFSSYLNAAEQNFVLNLSRSIQNPQSAILSNSGRKAEKGEISIFGAEKYFDVDVDDDPSTFVDDYARKLGYKQEKQIEIMKQSSNPKPAGTPSVVSEGSWNSQTALFRSKENKGSGKSFFNGLSCNHSCSDKKSVVVNQQQIELDRNPAKLQPQIPVKGEFRRRASSEKSGGKNREYFAHSIQKNGFHNPIPISLDEEQRKSIDVFGSQTVKKGDIAMYLEKKLSMLTWDAIPKSSTTGSGMNEEIVSDGSSDLFEIDNLSGNDQLPFSMMEDGSTAYEPSEASIEWSVVTAAAEEVAGGSDYEEKKMGGNGKERKIRSGGILGCKSYKSVRVAETNGYRTNGK